MSAYFPGEKKNPLSAKSNALIELSVNKKKLVIGCNAMLITFYRAVLTAKIMTKKERKKEREMK